MVSNMAVEALDIEATTAGQSWPLAKMRRAHENFPFKQMVRYVDDKTGSIRRSTPIFFDRALDDWMKYISPNTPPYGFSCSPSEPFLDYLDILLSAMSFVLDSHDPKHAATAASQIIPIWPSVWTWLQTFYDHCAQARSITTEENTASRCQLRYDTIVKILHLITHVHPYTPLATLAIETEGVVETLATMWIEEGNDIAATNGFSSCLFVQSHPSGISSQILSRIVVNCGGNADAAYRTLIRRIKNNIKQAQPDLASFSEDTRLIMEQLRARDTPVPAILHQAITSNPTFIADMVDVLTLLLAINSPASTAFAEIIGIPLLIIFTRCEIDCYHSVFQLSTTRIINLIPLLNSRYGSDKRVRLPSAQLLDNVIGRYLVYRPLLYPVAGSVIEMMDACGDEPPKGPVGEAMIALSSRLADWTEVDEKYKTLHHQYLFDCGNLQCTVSDELCTGTFRRCSGCLLVQYCSEGCQRKHWREQHKRLCSLKSQSNREPAGLSGPGLRYLTHIIVHDCMALTPKQRLPFVQDLSADGARTSILLLDYESPARDRVAVKVLDMQDPAAISRLAKSAPQFDVTEDWRRCWGTTSLVSSEHLRSVMPVIVLFPRGWGDPQVMTCIFTLHSPTPGEESKLAKPLNGKPHVRWLHRF